jgi:hypothetical protein
MADYDELPGSPERPNQTRAPSSARLSSPANFLLSPPRSQGKEKRQPSVTPRRFGRFFTPRSAYPSRLAHPRRRVLGDLPESVSNAQTAETMSDASIGGLGEPFTPSTNNENTVPSASRSPRTLRKRPLDSSPIPPSKRRETLQEEPPDLGGPRGMALGLSTGRTTATGDLPSPALVS